MGLAKTQLMEEMSRDFTSMGNKYVCTECFDDDGIKEYIANHGSPFNTCSYCSLGENICFNCEKACDCDNENHGDCKKIPLCVKLDELIEHILRSLENVYLYYREGDFCPSGCDDGDDLWDILDWELGEIEQQVLTDIQKATCGGEKWFRKTDYDPDRNEIWLKSWDKFCEYYTKYGIDSDESKLEECIITDDYGCNPDGYIRPKRILKTLFTIFRITKLYKKIPPNTPFYRSRQGDLKREIELYPPPNEFTKSQRMSREGDSVFYCAQTEKDACEECLRAYGNKTQ